jgi:glycosyltransferase involved in cell wall biosynthesis
MLVREVGCGLVVRPGRPDLLAEAIRELMSGAHDLDEMGARGRRYVEVDADRELALDRYRELLADLVA